MARNATAPGTRLRRLGVAVFVGYLLIAALTAYAAVTTGPASSGGSRPMFTLVTASVLAFALAGLVTAAAAHAQDPRWKVVVVTLLMVSGALLLAAAMQENGGLGVLVIGGAMLLPGWWLVQTLRANHTDRPTRAADAPVQPSG